MLSKKKMCGICCLVKASRNAKSRCVGVEFAAKEFLHSSQLPTTWPDEDYNGRKCINMLLLLNSFSKSYNKKESHQNIIVFTHWRICVEN